MKNTSNATLPFQIIIIVLLLFAEEVVVVGQTFRFISSQVGQQLSECVFSYPYAVVKYILLCNSPQKVGNSPGWLTLRSETF